MPKTATNKNAVNTAATKTTEPKLSLKILAEKQSETDNKLDNILNLMTGIVEKLEPGNEPEEVVDFSESEQGQTLSRDSSSDAINHPSISKNYAESEDNFTGGLGDAEIEEDKDGNQFMQQPLNADVSSASFKDWLANMKHANEKISIMVHQTSENNADKTLEVSVNGHSMIFERGIQYDNIPRYLVEALIRAKPIQYDNHEYKNSEGLQEYKYVAQRGLRYPFNIVNPTSRDEGWFKNLQAQP
jgi:hypothetical protein